MKEKKVIAFIVEGPSDETALGSIMKEYFSNHEVQFVVVHGDITLKDYVTIDKIKVKISDTINEIKKKYRYCGSDFIKIIHIVDTDGVFIPDENVKEANVEKKHNKYDATLNTNTTMCQYIIAMQFIGKPYRFRFCLQCTNML